ncbi:MAG: DUF1638 domain-containing protein [Proteobacteria bacterium]|jgi:hypothetical protein|nr:DUF1638 domain-containing protein [Pseudomonadota bacterium]
MPKLKDSNLTFSGIEIINNQKVLLIACGALAKEIVYLIDLNNWQHLDLICLPAILHNNPEKITPLVVSKIKENQEKYTSIFVAYADCGTGGELKNACRKLGVEIIAGPHCYSFYEGNQEFEQRDEITAFYLTDFLVRQFNSFVIKPLGLDKHPELRDTYFRHYEKLVYQAQTNDPELDKLAEAHAKTLGLNFERRFTGFGQLEIELSNFK